MITEGKDAIFAVLAAFLVLVMSSGLQAVDTSEIDKVRSKGVLDSADLQIIDEFVAEAVQELVETKDFTSIAKTRSVILAHRASKASVQVQYAEQFSESAYKYISAGLEQARELTPEAYRFKVIINLLILIDGLGDLRLVDLAKEWLNNESPVIRYWAVHCVTNADIIKRLNSDEEDNSELAAELVSRLGELVDSSGPEITALMVTFASELNIAQGEDLLGQIADKRISKYADWTVDYELLDAAILKLLCDKITSAEPGRSLPGEKGDKADVARRFGQLCSYVLQRYVKGQDVLNDTQKQQLASVLIETEKSCISKLLEVPQSVIKRAVAQENLAALMQEHSRLFGSQTSPGQLTLKLDFDYGSNPDGSKRTVPLDLPEPPKKLTIGN